MSNTINRSPVNRSAEVADLHAALLHLKESLQRMERNGHDKGAYILMSYNVEQRVLAFWPELFEAREKQVTMYGLPVVRTVTPDIMVITTPNILDSKISR